MNGIIITDGNFNRVVARMANFFNRASIVTWHSFDCKMKRHIPTGFVQDIGGNKKERIKTVHRYYCTRTEVVEYGEQKYIVVRLDSKHSWSLKVGDVVKFCGNRIHTRSEWPASGHNWIYFVFQRWDKNGGFKDIRLERE